MNVLTDYGEIEERNSVVDSDSENEAKKSSKGKFKYIYISLAIYKVR